LAVFLYSLALFFFNTSALTELSTLSLRDALPICPRRRPPWLRPRHAGGRTPATACLRCVLRQARCRARVAPAPAAPLSQAVAAPCPQACRACIPRRRVRLRRARAACTQNAVFPGG